MTDPQAVLVMPRLSLSIAIASLYERVMIATSPRPRLVWEDEGA